jgi:hypothetical protein
MLGKHGGEGKRAPPAMVQAGKLPRLSRKDLFEVGLHNALRDLL